MLLTIGRVFFQRFWSQKFGDRTRQVNIMNIIGIDTKFLPVKGLWAPKGGFFLKKLIDTCPFVVPLIPLFWTSGDISSGFQSLSECSQGGFIVLKIFLHLFFFLLSRVLVTWSHKINRFKLTRCSRSLSQTNHSEKYLNESISGHNFDFYRKKIDIINLTSSVMNVEVTQRDISSYSNSFWYTEVYLDWK